MMPRVEVSPLLPAARIPTVAEQTRRWVRHLYAAGPSWSEGGYWSPTLGDPGPPPDEPVWVHAVVEKSSPSTLRVSAELREQLRRVTNRVGHDSIEYETADGTVEIVHARGVDELVGVLETTMLELPPPPDYRPRHRLTT